MTKENVKLLLVDSKDAEPDASTEIDSLLKDGWKITRTSLRILEGGVVKTLVVLQNSASLHPRKPAV